MNITIHFPGTAKDKRQIVLATELQNIECHGDILQRTVRLFHQLMHLGVGRKVYHQVEVLRIFNAYPSFKAIKGLAQVLQQSFDFAGPGIRPFIYTNYIIIRAICPLDNIEDKET